ncbi:MAG: AMP-binding protein [Phycisphaerae bacterium]|jgi:long-chain acyl-CoA synthetase|nr:AMP-binding protein [Phycisphaerae bacterium]
MQLLRSIRRQLLWHPRRLAAIDDQRSWRGIDLLVGSWHLAKAIESTSSRDAVAVMLPTSGLFPMAVLAGWTLGRKVVPINYLLSKADIGYVLKDAGCDTVVTVQPMIDFIGGMPDGVRALRMEDVRFTGLPLPRLANPIADEDVAILLYTSGTSGKPKGVMLTGANLAANVRQVCEWVDFTTKDVMLGVLPQFHSFGLTVLTLLPLAVGCRVVYTAKFLPKRIVELSRRHRPTAVIAIPSMYNALLMVKDGKPADFEAVRFAVSGGEPLPKSVFDGFQTKFGVRLNEGYGLTETSPVTNWCRPHEFRPRTVGKPLPEIDQRIIGPDGSELGPNQDGEVRMKGPNIMRGYHNLPEETAKTFDEKGYFRTGDMGRFDDDGFLYITGRIKEMLIIGGENVFPREIEEVLNRHPSVKDSAVVGMSDESRGEVALAFVELHEGEQFDGSALRAFCREHLAQFKVPREIRWLETLPRNGTGKIVRRQLSVNVAGKESA